MISSLIFVRSLDFLGSLVLTDARSDSSSMISAGSSLSMACIGLRSLMSFFSGAEFFLMITT